MPQTLLVKNPQSQVVVSPLGQRAWSATLDIQISRAKRSAKGSRSRQIAAIVLVRDALGACASIVPPAGSTEGGLAPIGVNTWIVPYLENAVRLLNGDKEVDW